MYVAWLTSHKDFEEFKREAQTFNGSRNYLAVALISYSLAARRVSVVVEPSVAVNAHSQREFLALQVHDRQVYLFGIRAIDVV